MGAIRRPTGPRAALVALLALIPTAAPAQEPSTRRFPTAAATPGDLPEAIDDRIVRPTVLVRKGDARGSGTIIGSTPGKALILTAAHVIDGPGEPGIELHRYNLGIEGRRLGGTWPKVVPARVVAVDPEADVAVLLVEGLAKLPYVATLDPGIDQAPPGGTAVTSVGIDQASDLNRWDSQIRGTATLSRGALPRARSGAGRQDGGGAQARGDGDGDGDGSTRLFLITEHPPIEGRSGGGLYSSEGRLLGLCVGRIEAKGAGGEARAIGLFASGPSILRVLERLRPADRPSN